MGFYKDKLKKYKDVSISSENLGAVKNQIIDAMTKRYNKLLEDLKYEEVFGASINGLAFLTNDVFKEIQHLEHEISFVSMMSNEDFYNYYKNMEVFSVSNYCSKLNEKKKEIHKLIEAYKNKKGLSGKLSALFGTTGDKVAKYKSEMDSLSAELLKAEDTLIELKALKDDELLKYIVGRFEVDEKFEFDVKELEEYIKQSTLEPTERGE